MCGDGEYAFSEVDGDGALIFEWKYAAAFDPQNVFIDLVDNTMRSSMMEERVPLEKRAVRIFHKALTRRMLAYLKSCQSDPPVV